MNRVAGAHEPRCGGEASKGGYAGLLDALADHDRVAAQVLD